MWSGLQHPMQRLPQVLRRTNEEHLEDAPFSTPGRASTASHGEIGVGGTRRSIGPCDRLESRQGRRQGDELEKKAIFRSGALDDHSGTIKSLRVNCSSRLP